MPIAAKDIVILLLGLIGSLIIGLFLEKANINSLVIKDYLTIIGIIFVVVSAIIIVTYRKFSEVDKELESQKLKQNRLDEKLKIYERLAIIEKRVFENGNKS